MKMDYRVLTETERKYTFSQSQQLSMQTGLIGYLRADFGSTPSAFSATSVVAISFAFSGAAP